MAESAAEDTAQTRSLQRHEPGQRVTPFKALYPSQSGATRPYPPALASAHATHGSIRNCPCIHPLYRLIRYRATLTGNIQALPLPPGVARLWGSLCLYAHPVVDTAKGARQESGSQVS